MTTRGMMQQQPLTFAERTQSAVRAFLRSAVVVDDELGATASSSVATPLSTAERSDPTLQGLGPVIAPADEDLQPSRMDPQRIIQAFADRDIVCAAIRPDDRDGSSIDRLIRVASRADLVTVDWNMGGEAGSIALRVVEALRNAAGRRVVAIYTKTPQLDEIREALAGLPEAAPDVSSTRFDFGSLAVVILLKPESGVKFGPDEQQVVSETDLPDRLIDEFGRAAGGLLANAALRGLAAIRDRTPQVLSALSPALDAGYLTHRFLLDSPADAEEHAVMLVALEAASTLSTTDIEGEVGIDAIRAWLVDRGFVDRDIPAGPWNEIFKESRERRLDAIVTVLEVGLNEARRIGSVPKLKDERKVHQPVVGLFAPSTVAGTESSEHFAHRMSIRTSYQLPPRRLGFGSLIALDTTLFVSIQPACDAVRLKADTAFPLLTLERVVGKGGFDLVVASGDMKGHFRIPHRFRDIELVTFIRNPDREAVLEQLIDGEWRFLEAGGKGRKFALVGELRESTAMRTAKHVADRLSRVGLDESDWLRRSVPPDPDDAVARELDRRD
jgi:hypothetical protein